MPPCRCHDLGCTDCADLAIPDADMDDCWDAITVAAGFLVAALWVALIVWLIQRGGQ